MKTRRVSDIQVSYHPKLKISEMPIIICAKDAYEIAYERWDKGKIQFIEQLKVMFLNRNSRLLGIYEASSGGIYGTLVDPKVIFIAALNVCATSIILVHNHPSGNLVPSNADRNLTDKIATAGTMLEIILLDHIIIGQEGFVSFKEEGWL